MACCLAPSLQSFVFPNECRGLRVLCSEEHNTRWPIWGGQLVELLEWLWTWELLHGVVPCCSAVLLNIRLCCLLASSLQDCRTGHWGLIHEGWCLQAEGLFEKSVTSRLILKSRYFICALATCIPSPSSPGFVNTGRNLAIDLGAQFVHARVCLSGKWKAVILLYGGLPAKPQ